METTDHARIAYNAMAPIYDAFNHENQYDDWFDVLIPKLEEHGLPEEGRLLDVACGTGRAFDPIFRCGWARDVIGCDISFGMIAQAASKFPDVELHVVDMRELPVFDGDGFELVWALNDPVNYLLTEGDLQLALESMGRNLSHDGLLVFDVNTLALFRSNFGEGLQRDDRWQWEGRGEVDGIWEATISGVGVETHLHRERHWSVVEVQRAMLAGGLEPLGALGQREVDGEVAIADSWDEDADHKIVHVARKPD